MQPISARRPLPAMAGGAITGPCYQPIGWYIANLLRDLTGKDPLDPVLICAL